MIVSIQQIGAAMPPPRPQILSARVFASVPEFLPVSGAQTTSPPAPVDRHVELRRGAVATKTTWPIAAAAECATRMRALYIEPWR